MSHLERNLLAINTAQSSLKSAVLNSGHSGVTFQNSKTNQTIPFLLGKTLASTYDPVKEALRISDTVSEDSFIVLFGLGSGHLLESLLNNSRVKGILLIEPELKVLKDLLIHFDFVHFFRDPRVHFCCLELHPSPSRLLMHLYLPIIHGTFKTLSLRSYTEIYIKEFNQLKEKLNESIDIIADDISVQKKFGKRWFKQSLCNLHYLYENQTAVTIESKAVLCGAGPELENKLDLIRDLSESASVIATDTAFPVLVKHNIRVDYIFSIDCQVFSHLHILGNKPPVMILDFASPLGKLGTANIMCGSGYPFSIYVKEHLCDLYAIDTSGGNVAYSALSFLDNTKVKEVHIFGVDFYNPDFKSYARGSYLYDYFYERQNAVHTIESSFLDFIFQYEHPVQPKHMNKYLLRFIELCTTVSCRVFHYHKGEVDTYEEKNAETRRLIRNPEPAMSLNTFYEKLIQDFTDLEIKPNTSPGENPLYATLVSIMPSLGLNGRQGITEAKKWVLQVLTSFKN